MIPISYRDSESFVYSILNECCDILYECDNIFFTHKIPMNLKKVQIYKGKLNILFENSDLEIKKATSLCEHNVYAKLLKMNNLLSNEMINNSKGYISLNESINDKYKNFSVEDFKKIIDKSLKSLKKINDIQTYSKHVLKIKKDLNMSLNIWGFDIKELVQKYPDVYCLMYDTISNNILLIFVENIDNEQPIKISKILSYNLENDTIAETKIVESINDKLHNMNSKNIQIANGLNVLNFETLIKNNFQTNASNLVTLYKYIEKSGIKFTDNVYGDLKRRIENEKSVNMRK